MRLYILILLHITIYTSSMCQNYVLKFDGIDDYVDLGNSIELQKTDNFTASVWVKANQSGSDQGILAKATFNGSFNNRKGWTLYKQASTDKFCFRPFSNGNGTPICSNTAYNDSSWHNIVIKVDNGLASIYVDKIKQIETTYDPIEESGGSMVIGRTHIDNNAAFFNNEIDEVAYWNTALSDLEIKKIKCDNSNIISTTALVGYWKFNEGSGNLIIDSSANSLTGWNTGAIWVQDTLCNKVTNEGGEYDNYVLKFDGLNDYVDLGNSLSLQETNNFTASVWCKPNPSSTALGILAKATFNGSFNKRKGWTLYRQANTNKFCFRPYTNGTGTPICSDIGYSDLDWHHIVIKVENGLSSIYIDKIKQIETTLDPIEESGGSMVIGRTHIDHNEAFFNSKIDEVAYWNAPLSDSEIQSISCDNASIGSSSSLVGYWKFNEGSGNLVIDSSANNVTGWNTGAVWLKDTLCNNIISTTVSLPITETNECIVYPNPFTSIVNVTIHTNNSNVELDLYDVLGNLVSTYNQTNFIINGENLRDGMYFIKGNINDIHHINKRIIKY